MKWEKYALEFSKAAIENGFNQVEIDFYLTYAKNLFNQNLPIIFDQEHFSLLVGYKKEYLIKASNSPLKFYRRFRIPKKSGGQREISEPLPSLKEIQRWILDEILTKCYVSGYAKAYKNHQSIKDNAKFHVNHKIVLTIDIKDFFPSLKWNRVYCLYKDIGYSSAVAMMLSNLTCLNGSLPQGAPTSPAISNILLNRFDKRIVGFTKLLGINYTRYADDLTFSGDFPPGVMIRFVKEALNEMGLVINTKKIRVRKGNRRQEVTGIVVNEKMQVSKETRKELRQAVYYIRKFGLSSHLTTTHNQKVNSLRHYLGIANFILFINPNDAEVKNYKQILLKYLPLVNE